MANIEAGRQRILVGQLYGFANALEMDVQDLMPSVDSRKTRVVNSDYELPLNKDIPQSYWEATKRVMSGSK